MKSFKRLSRRLFWETLPKRAVCLFLRHRWEPPQPVVVDGPIDLPPRERDWMVLAFHKQCGRCYVVKSVVYSFTDAETAVRGAIRNDEGDK